MATEAEIAWAAGIFEGEGCIQLNWNWTRSRSHATPATKLTVTMIDRDTVTRLHDILGGKLRGPHRMSNSDREYWTWAEYGYEPVGRIIELLKPWLSARRLAKWAETEAARHTRREA